jgi:ferredoxin-NADP reductase
VSDVARPQPNIVEVRLRPLSETHESIFAKPGQFALLAFGSSAGFHGCGEFHPFTLSAIDEDGQWRVAIKALGACSNHLQALVPGVPARVEGPFGDFLAASGQQPALWLAGGIGITPFMARLRAPDNLAETRLLFFVRVSSEIPYRDELDALTRLHPSFSWEACIAGPTEDLGSYLPDTAALVGRDCYLCGPPAWMDRVIDVLGQRGVPRDRIDRKSVV